MAEKSLRMHHIMKRQTSFERKFGFARRQVTLANWRTAPFNRWSFQNVGELVPSAPILPDAGMTETGPQDASALLAEPLALTNGPETVQAFLERSHADALTVMKAGKFVGDWVAPHMQFGACHIVFSISKS